MSGTSHMYTRILPVLQGFTHKWHLDSGRKIMCNYILRGLQVVNMVKNKLQRISNKLVKQYLTIIFNNFKIEA